MRVSNHLRGVQRSHEVDFDCMDAAAKTKDVLVHVLRLRKYVSYATSQ